MKKFRHVQAPLSKTLIYRLGNERAEHERLPQQRTLQVFFAIPHSPWQLGIIQNTNGFLGLYLPKGTNLSGDNRRALNAIEHRTNTRLRKCSTSPHCWRCSLSCVIVHPMYVGLETAWSNSADD